MRRIALAQAIKKEFPIQYAIVDDEDYEFLSKFNWHTSYGYAVRNYKKTSNKKTIISMHWCIMNTPKGKQVDHINGNRLDNRRKNLRICTKTQNNWNNKGRKIVKIRGKYKGVYWMNLNQKWMAQIRAYQKCKYLGLYSNQKDAAKAYNQAAIKYFGKYAKLNKV